MWIRRAAMGMCIVFGVGFGFVLSSCMTPPVEGQATGFPPMTVGNSYAFFGSESISGVVEAIGPYPWVEVTDNSGNVNQVNLEQLVYYREL